MTRRNYIGGAISAVSILAAVCLCWWLSLLWHGAMSAFDVALQNPQASADHREALLSRPVYLDGDCYMWIVHAKEAREAKTWRLRYTHADNPPFGRDMQWSQSMIWLERLASHFFAAGFKNPDLRLEWAASWVNTAVQMAFVAAAALLVWYTAGRFAAAITPFLLIGMGDLSFSFHPFRPDHQTLYCLFAMLAVMCPVCGLTNLLSLFNKNRPSPAKSFIGTRAWFAIGGAALGLLFWLGATVAMITLALLIATWSATVFVARRELSSVLSTAEWRAFGFAAGLVSLLMYLVEYAPNYFSWHLEVNHPLYSVALVACGGILSRISVWQFGLNKLSKNERISTFVLILLFLLPVIVAAFGGPNVFALHDLATRRMTRFIGEYQPYFYPLSFDKLIHVLFVSDALMPVLAIVALGYALFTKVANRLVLLWIGFLSLIFWIITVWQSRWSDFASMFAVFSVVIGYKIWKDDEAVRFQRDRTISTVLTGVLLIQIYSLLWFRYTQPMGMLRHTSVDPGLIKPLMVKRFAVDLHEALPNASAMSVMAEPDLAPALKFFAGITSCSSSYWPNIAGVGDGVSFFNDQSPAAERATEIAKTRNLVLVILPSGQLFRDEFWYLEHGMHDIGKSDRTLLGRMLVHPNEVPDWLTENRDLESKANPSYSLSSRQIQNAYHIWTINLGSRP